jgi:GNAT superfamily N-acetyltransferase
MMFDIDKMFQTEISFCDSFTNRVETEYGKVYYNPFNPLSHDSNHAHILKNLDHPEKTAQDIKIFFRNFDLIPRIYPSFIKGELEILRPHLISEGFTVKVFDSRTFYIPPKQQPSIDSTISVKRITRIQTDIIELIHTNDDGDWTINVLNRHVDDKRFHLLGLFEAKKAVSIASVKTMDGYSRVDDVLTHTDYRGRHFGTRLMNYLVGYHRNISNNYLYLWADSPIAIKMYLRVGFKEIQTQMPNWTAYVE